MAKYKVGDKVRIVDKPFERMPIPGGMCKYLNSIMTIEDIDSDGDYWMIEDGGEWCWGLNMIAGLVNDKVELHPDFAEWYEEITNRWTTAKAFSIYLINQIGFGHLLEDAENNIVEEKYKELSDDMNNNKEKYTRAILDDNWTVRKEQLYYVELSIRYDKYLNQRLDNNELCFSTRERRRGFKTKFTEKEIKAIDERYWAFKTPVEED